MLVEDRSVSIVVPIYKTPQYLPQCIESVLAQTYTHWQLILVDDGSPDECGEIADRYAQHNSVNSDSSQNNSIRVIHKPNGGQSSARNMGA